MTITGISSSHGSLTLCILAENGEETPRKDGIKFCMKSEGVEALSAVQDESLGLK